DADIHVPNREQENVEEPDKQPTNKEEQPESQASEDGDASPGHRAGVHNRLHAEEGEHDDNKRRVRKSPDAEMRDEPLPTAQLIPEFKRRLSHRHASAAERRHSPARPAWVSYELPEPLSRAGSGAADGSANRPICCPRATKSANDTAHCSTSSSCA